MHPLETFWTRTEAPWWLSLVTLLLGASITWFVTWTQDRQRNAAAKQAREDERLQAERALQRERARSDVIALLVGIEQVRLGVVEEYNRVVLAADSAEKEAVFKEASATVAQKRAVVSQPMQGLVISTYPTLRDAAQKAVDASASTTSRRCLLRSGATRW